MENTGRIPRRRMLVDKRFQSAFTRLWVITCAFALVICAEFLGFAWYFIPEQAQSNAVTFLVEMALSFIGFCVLMGIMTLRLTRRVASGSHRFQESLERIRRNDLDTPIDLRPDDYLHGMAQALEELRAQHAEQREISMALIKALESMRSGLSAEQREVVEKTLKHLKVSADIHESGAHQRPPQA